MNVWVSKPAGDAIDRAVAKGRFKSRQEAIAYALEAIFIREERNVVT
jgi:Arc/MetJ-type ribon-helix-helix transcriptional regulator